MPLMITSVFAMCGGWKIIRQNRSTITTDRPEHHDHRDGSGSDRRWLGDLSPRAPRAIESAS